MEKMKLKEFWQTRNGREKTFIFLKAADECYVSIDTVKAWMLGYRKPTGLKRDALLNFIKDNFNVEIIEEGGTR